MCQPAWRNAPAAVALPDLADQELRAGLDLLPSWVLEVKAAANRRSGVGGVEGLEVGQEDPEGGAATGTVLDPGAAAV
jgi:hypothetical protein